MISLRSLNQQSINDIYWKRTHLHQHNVHVPWQHQKPLLYHGYYSIMSQKLSLTKEEYTASESSKSIMEDCIEYEKDPLFSNNKTRIHSIQAYSQYWTATEYPFSNILSNIDSTVLNDFRSNKRFFIRGDLIIIDDLWF